jgi:hypothetical protein
MVPTTTSKAFESWTFAAEWITASGMPCRSTTITALGAPFTFIRRGPVFWPPDGGNARRVQGRPLPVDLIGLAEAVEHPPSSRGAGPTPPPPGAMP